MVEKIKHLKQQAGEFQMGTQRFHIKQNQHLLYNFFDLAQLRLDNWIYCGIVDFKSNRINIRNIVFEHRVWNLEKDIVTVTKASGAV
ncbi:MAG: hypothetical protein RHS_2068 [Robinsoniella sp. RHS]|nr:MAG: hypothetical protein RHS_2068 [Robinsoniella sp. RHS]